MSINFHGFEKSTIIHECVHWDKHYKFFELQKILIPELNSISCAVVGGCKKEGKNLKINLNGWNGKQTLLRRES